jgi:archaellum component FlaC
MSLNNCDTTSKPEKESKKAKSKGKSKKIPKPAKKSTSKGRVAAKDDVDSLKAFEDYLLFKREGSAIRRSTTSSFLPDRLDTRGTINISLRFKKHRIPNSKDYIDNNTTMSNYEAPYPRDAVKQIAKDYEYLKEKLIKMQQKLDDSERDKERLENQLETIKTENVKFISDIKIMKSEHSEIMHTMSTIERKIDQLERENCYFRSIIETRGRDTIQSMYDRGPSITEENETQSEVNHKQYISDGYPKTHANAETRCMPFKPNNGMTTSMSTERLDISNMSSQKGSFGTVNKASKKRFLIPKPDSRMTAEFKPAHNL